jgi:isoleucine--tRNA ligase
LAVEAVFGGELPAGKPAAELDMGDGLCWHIALEKAGG